MNNCWVKPEVRNDVVETILSYNNKTKLTIKELLSYGDISRTKFYEWKKRYGYKNNHNGKIPKSHWLLEDEKEAIVRYAGKNYETGYRRLTYMMIDEDIAYSSPSTVYRILKENDLLNKYIETEESKKGEGYIQPERSHEEWHIDITYVNMFGSFMFLVGIIDGYSRFIVYHELRKSMKDKDISLVVQRAHERFPGEKPRIISDRGGQFISRDFRKYLRNIGLKQTYTSVGYPQSNGKIERFFRTAKEECIRRNSFLSLEDARRVIEKYIEYYNYDRLHSAIDYITPYDMMRGRREQIIEERRKKLEYARKIRRENHVQKTNLFKETILSDFR